MPGPRDFMTGGEPQGASYSAPQIGLAIGDRLAQLPEQAFAARQRARTEMLQQPVVDSNGNVITDPTQLAKELIRRGGTEAATALYPLMWKGQFLHEPNMPWTNPANNNEPAPRAAPEPPPTPTAKQWIHGGYPAPAPQPPQQRPPAGTSGAPGPAPSGGVGFGDRFNATYGGQTGLTPNTDMPGAALTPPEWLQHGYTPQQYADFAMAQARSRSIADVEGAKTWQARGQAVLDAIKQDSALTNEAKNARASGMTPLGFEGAKAEATQRAEADTKYIQDISKQALEGTQRNIQLNAIDELGQRVGWGPQAKAAVWIGEHLGIATQGYDNIRAYKAAIDFLAPRLRPEGQGRLLEWEFHGFKGAIGGLDSTPEGRRLLIQGLKLVNDYNISLGRIANNPNLSNAQKRTMMDQVQPPQLPVAVHSKAEYDQVPPGHPYLHPDGTVRAKPAQQTGGMR